MTAASNQPRIFVVEDDPVMLRMVGDYLEQHNMQVVSASGRQEMLRYFAVREPNLVILDLRLGQELCCARTAQSAPWRIFGPSDALERSCLFLFTNVGHPIELYSPQASSRRYGRIRGRKECWGAGPSTAVCIG